MLQPRLPGWKIETVGDDIAWIRIGKDGRLWAVNPEAGFFGVAPGTSTMSNPVAMETLKNNVLFTNVAMTKEGDVWWEGMSKESPAKLTSWLRTEHNPGSGYEAAHANARFTVAAKQCPTMDPAWENPEGVPLTAIIFGGRRSNTVPLVYQSRDWAHGVFIGATMSSETTAATMGKRGMLRNDPFAMKPFCGYNMGDYMKHWLSFAERTSPNKLPKVFHVNWFRKSKTGKFLWPGFGDNLRVLDWILQRCEASGELDAAVASPLGYLPSPGSINTKGLDITSEAMEELSKVDSGEMLQDVLRNKQFLAGFKERLPDSLSREFDTLEQAFREQVHEDRAAAAKQHAT